MDSVFNDRIRLYWYYAIIGSSRNIFRDLLTAIKNTFFVSISFEIPNSENLFLLSFERKDYVIGVDRLFVGLTCQAFHLTGKFVLDAVGHLIKFIEEAFSPFS